MNPTYLYAILLVIDHWNGKPIAAEELPVLGILIALVKLDEIRNAGKPKWRLEGKWGDGWHWVKK